jgi:hypothetical protein
MKLKERGDNDAAIFIIGFINSLKYVRIIFNERIASNLK